jgi:hypothetical protein
MRRRAPDLDPDPELEAVLEPRKIERRAPPEIRARALARARAIVAAGGAVPPARRTELPAPVPLRVSVPAGRGRGLVRVALAASIAVTVGAVAAVAALRNRAADMPPVASQISAQPAPALRAERLPATASESPTVAIQDAMTVKPARRPRPGGAVDPFAAELDLLQRAHAAYTRRDFSGALTLIAGHARGFPNGPLAEQREALRVRALIGSGRSEEAHRAAAAFAVSFPRSVLLPRVEGDAKAPE